MQLLLEMRDKETDELLAHRYCEYELNFSNKDDRGFQTLVSWCRSAVRGIRLKNMQAIELRFLFWLIEISRICLVVFLEKNLMKEQVLI